MKRQKNASYYYGRFLSGFVVTDSKADHIKRITYVNFGVVIEHIIRFSYGLAAERRGRTQRMVHKLLHIL